MSKCRQCNVTILDNVSICPLCQCAIDVDLEIVEQYPDIHMKQLKRNLFLRIYTAAVIAVEILLIYINYRFSHETLWSLISAAAFFYGFCILKFILNSNAGYRKRIVILTVLATAYIVLIDYVFGGVGWSVNYVIPGAIMFLDLTVVILMVVNFRNWQSYMLMEIALFLLNFIPLVLVWIGITTRPFLTWLSLFVSFVLFLCTYIVGGRRASAELKRRFHI